MIYPAHFPLNNNNKAEQATFLALNKLNKDDYDVFFSRSFSALEKGERVEYEADFIIADIRKQRIRGILIIEVKGGQISYDGITSRWEQNGRELFPSPTDQVTSILHSLIKRFDFLVNDVPMGWAVWFPDMFNPGNEFLPTELHERQYFDSVALTYPEKFIQSAFEYIYEQWSFKKGNKIEVYNRFKEPLIRNLGFALPLHKKIEAAEIKFIELTKKQLELLRLISINPNILIRGPAGSGKTIMATTIAREQADQGKKVLLLTFNRVLANNIRYGLGNVENPQVANYHSLARGYIDRIDENWWNGADKDQEFWELGVPIKMMEALKGFIPEYDTIIIDEAQDLKTEWFETLELLIKPKGSFYIFKDSDQDIFGANSEVKLNRNLFQFDLTENCRNTVQIIDFLKRYSKRDIKYQEDAVHGEPVKIIEYSNDTDQMNKIKAEWLHLVEEENISPNKILLMMNADKRKSCLANTKKFDRYKIESLSGRTGQLNRNCVNYSSINIFKGLEVEIVFIIDTDKVLNPDMKILYAQASRAKYLLTVFKKLKKNG
ncbi:nuclease-related domain-containing DEAD/DEAH box helicase [Maribellus mangrovi]|uniref:nuclease-related domain-containing DEAD/DEAH box helicase n=1 Tax=Maribellus mangrovi TaxID=3133146 RepID=UPI0030ECB83F